MTIDLEFINNFLLEIAGYLFSLLAIVTLLSLKKGVGVIELMKSGSRVYADLESYFKKDRIFLILFITYTTATVFILAVLILLLRVTFLRQ